MSQNITQTLNQIKSLIYNGNVQKIINNVKNKNIVVFLGNTRGGKSTIVNHVLGTPLKANKVRNNVFNIIKENSTSPGPRIGVGSASETSIPSVYNSPKLVNTTVVDAPGFDDNRGPAQDIANSFYIKEILSNANSAKIVVICDINDVISDNINSFINLMDSLNTVLPVGDKLNPAITLVLNKDRDDLTKNNITDTLKNKIVNQPAIRIANRPLIEYLVRNPNQICIVKMPIQEGKLNEGQVFGNVVGTIQGNNGKLAKNILTKTSPGISTKSRNFLLQARNSFTEKTEFDQVMNSVKNNFNTSLATFKNVGAYTVSSQISPVKNRLTAIENNVKSIKNPSWSSKQLLQRMKTVVPVESQLNEGSNIYTKLEFIGFVDGLLNLSESNIFKVKINQTVNEMLNSVAQCRDKLNDRQTILQNQENAARLRELKRKQELEAERLRQEIERQKRIQASIRPPSPHPVDRVINNVIVHPVGQVTREIERVVKKCSIM